MADSVQAAPTDVISYGDLYKAVADKQKKALQSASDALVECVTKLVEASDSLEEQNQFSSAKQTILSVINNVDAYSQNVKSALAPFTTPLIPTPGPGTPNASVS